MSADRAKRTFKVRTGKAGESRRSVESPRWPVNGSFGDGFAFALDHWKRPGDWMLG